LQTTTKVHENLKTQLPRQLTSIQDKITKALIIDSASIY